MRQGNTILASHLRISLEDGRDWVKIGKPVERFTVRQTWTSKQQGEFETLQSKLNGADNALQRAKTVFGMRSAEYAVAMREKDEITAKINRLTTGLVPRKS